MQVKIKIVNALTDRVEIDNTIEVDSTLEVLEANHGFMSDTFADCFVNFSCDASGFAIFGQPRNMVKDEIAYEEGRMTWEEYCNKWFKGSLSGCNEDSPDGLSDADLVVLERYETEDWATRDASSF